jgi:hypothetical protein
VKELTFIRLSPRLQFTAVRPERRPSSDCFEVKSFQGASDIRDLELAIGQYVFYRSLLTRFEADRKLFLAVPASVLAGTLQEAIARPVLADLSISLFAFDPEREVIVQWIR